MLNLVSICRAYVDRTTVRQPCLPIMSPKLLYNFSVDQLAGHALYRGVSILSVFDKKLLIGHVHFDQLFIFSQYGRYLSNISINKQDLLCDVTWTPSGNIMYTVDNGNKLVVLSESGTVIRTIDEIVIEAPQLLSIFNGTIYIATSFGVYQSTDDGISWNLVCKANDRRQNFLAIKVNTGYNDEI